LYELLAELLKMFTQRVDVLELAVETEATLQPSIISEGKLSVP
jgi:hypothetical protein